MKKKVIKYASMVTMLILAVATLSHAVPNPGDVKVKEVVSISIKDSVDGKGYLADVKINFYNKGALDLRFRDILFSVNLQSVKYPTFLLGQGPIDQIDIPAEKNGQPGVAQYTITIDMGSKSSPATMKRMIKLFNIFGQPEQLDTVNITFLGKGSIGGKIESGWVYQTNMLAELEFRPSITRSVLIQ